VFPEDEDIPLHCLRALVCEKWDKINVVFIRVVSKNKTVWRLYDHENEIEEYDDLWTVLHVLLKTMTVPLYGFYEQAEYLEIMNNQCDKKKEVFSSKPPMITSKLIRGQDSSVLA